MLHQRTTIAGIGIAAAVAVGAAVLTGSHGTGYATAGPTVSSSVVRSQAATIAGKSEAILTDAQGMPLSYYAPDSATNPASPVASPRPGRPSHRPRHRPRRG